MGGKLSPAQRNWLTVLGQSGAPLCAPGPEIATYKALANRGMATKERWPGEPCEGWVITSVGIAWLKGAGIKVYANERSKGE